MRRAIQFLRYKAGEYNIDPKRIAAKGTSLCANAAIWLALHDDIANPGSKDPVLFRKLVYPYTNKKLPRML